MMTSQSFHMKRNSFLQKTTCFAVYFLIVHLRLGHVCAFTQRLVIVGHMPSPFPRNLLLLSSNPKTMAVYAGSNLNADIDINNMRDEKKKILMDLLSTVPSNVSTPKQLTSDVLSAVRDLEGYCPTQEEEVLSSLGGNWELLWTAQDTLSKEGSQSRIFNWIK